MSRPLTFSDLVYRGKTSSPRQGDAEILTQNQRQLDRTLIRAAQTRYLLSEAAREGRLGEVDPSSIDTLTLGNVTQVTAALGVREGSSCLPTLDRFTTSAVLSYADSLNKATAGIQAAAKWFNDHHRTPESDMGNLRAKADYLTSCQELPDHLVPQVTEDFHVAKSCNSHWQSWKLVSDAVQNTFYRLSRIRPREELAEDWRAAMKVLEKAKENMLVSIPDVDADVLSNIGIVTKDFTTALNDMDTALVMAAEGQKMAENPDRLEGTVLGDLKTQIPRLTERLHQNQAHLQHPKTATTERRGKLLAANSQSASASRLDSAGAFAGRGTRYNNVDHMLTFLANTGLTEGGTWLDGSTAFGIPRKEMFEGTERAKANSAIKQLVSAVTYEPDLDAISKSMTEALGTLAHLSRDATQAKRALLNQLKSQHMVRGALTEEELVRCLRDRVQKFKTGGEKNKAETLRKRLGEVDAGATEYQSMVTSAIDTLLRQVEDFAAANAETVTENSQADNGSIGRAQASALGAQATRDLYRLRIKVHPLGETDDRGGMSKTALKRAAHAAGELITSIMSQKSEEGTERAVSGGTLIDMSQEAVSSPTTPSEGNTATDSSVDVSTLSSGTQSNSE
ncbi:hypothetical protein I316_00271 [Kwoniella heveanensis BCC8398]|uniref:Uncharacterized protein n=1 Tax=Kwoniella heveanensis BCC8398 TaxID=1296120 RepID=A0A1B9H450_9TREE|nr:hypothetical protein I316_00271 [Kwoniella heveanensis BCC8398]